ncbi:MAG: magnesium and cobalt transport protein CorA, partial [Bacteroidia bacterium]|nr:magnesium and cobalt transport protein CorA [Bacteroidia bacterium]NNJ81500.1 magnesium and cobalt transport protein CorA [Flavobacteriaceae bacterium]
MTKPARKNRKLNINIIPRRKAENQIPGAVKYRGRKKDKITKLEIIDYSKSHFDTFYIEEVQDAFKFRSTDQVTWINVDGLSNT